MGAFGNWICLIFVQRRGKILGNWENFMLFKGCSWLGQGFLICGPGAQASCCFLAFFQRPPNLAAGLLQGEGLISPSVPSWGVLVENPFLGL
jgi:hypothetical protein